MGLTARLLSGERRQGRAPWDDFWYTPIGQFASGVEVTRTSVLGLTATWKAVRLLSQAMATMSFKLYRRRDDGGRDPAWDDPRFWIAYARPNQWQTSFRLREMLEGHLEIRGNAYGQKVENRAGELLYVIPLHPDRMRIETEAGQLVYVYTRPNHSERKFDPEEIVHLRGLSDDGVYGFDPLTVLRESFGIAIATQRFAAKYYENDATPGGVLSTDQVIDDSTHDRLKASWEESHKGVESSHHPAILEAGLEWKSIGITAQNAQMIESRRLSTEEIARAFDVPPHMVGASSGDSLTYTTVESAGIEFRQYAVLPRTERWEQELNAALLSPEEQRGGLFFKFNLNTLLRADSAARADYMWRKFQMGALSPDDARALDDENPLPDGLGQHYFVPANFIRLDQTAPASPPSPRELPATATEPAIRSLTEVAREKRQAQAATVRSRLRGTYETLITSTAQAVVNQEVREARDALDRAYADEPSRGVRRWMAAFQEREQRDATQDDVFRAWMEEFYAGFEGRWTAALGPVLVAYAELARDAVQENDVPAEEDEEREDVDVQAFVDDYAATMASAQVSSSRNQLEAIIQEESEGEEGEEPDTRTALATRLDEWEEKRAGKVGNRESAQLGNATAWFVMGALGVTLFRWHTFGDSCRWCRQLSGRVVGREEYFLVPGDTLRDGEDTFEAKQHCRHPPAHGGCDCSLVAEG